MIVSNIGDGKISSQINLSIMGIIMTQDELDEINKLFSHASTFTASEDLDNWKIEYETPIILDDKQRCIHEFKLYTGFTDVYEYCVHCDLKV